jgi:hypothetical protein
MKDIAPHLPSPVAAAALLCFMLLAAAGSPARAENGETYAGIDRHALAAPPDEEQSLVKLAAYLAKPCKTDIEKTRAIYRWVTDRIAYDFDAFRRGTGRDDKAEAVLTNRRAVCEGYSNLFADLCSRMGVKAVKIAGFGKGFGYRPRTTFSRTNHAWNAVQIDGKWRLIDATWGAGFIQNDKFVKRFSEFFFLTPPEKLIFTHFPQEAERQLLDSPITQQQFEQQPKVHNVLFEMGVSANELRDAMKEEGFRDFVKSYAHPGDKTFIISAPVALYLQAGSPYSFEMKSEDYDAITLFNGVKPQPLQRDGNVFRQTVTLQRGPAKIAGTLKSEPNRYHTILEYFVKR